MNYSRREVLAAGIGSFLHLAARAGDERSGTRPAMGVVIHSYGIRRSADKEAGVADPLTFLDYCRSLGAGGVQTSLGVRDEAYSARLRDTAEKHQLYVEASIGLPRTKEDVARFAAEVRTAKACGADVFRTVFMTGRRYEVFDRLDEFRRFMDQARQALVWARPVVEKHRLRMAIENHKDLRTGELLEIVRKQDSPLVGVCVYTGNNLALLETPRETVDMLSPHAFTSHIKDMGVAEFSDGFLLSEVPLGTGMLDLPAVVARLRQANPNIRLNLEMITRDPLRVPVLTKKYWATQEDVPARRLAEMLALVRAKAAKLPRVSDRPRAEQLRVEDENVRRSLRYARKCLR